MRTTVTLDPDVAAKLRFLARERGVSFKAALNDAVRAGVGGEGHTARPYRVPARRMGVREGVDLDHAGRLLGELEDAEIVRKLALRK
jgi:predicted transcriptional regulator